jgi:peptidoglycan/xylan/chitin deacetylase (PgdA/CDA1 family)
MIGNMNQLLSCFILSFVLAYTASAQAYPGRSASDQNNNLEYFSYCSNGTCRLITGEFFHNARGMPVDLNVSCKKNNQYALTFDDGPSKNYQRLLELLKKNNVKASFFVVGSNLQTDEGRQWFRDAYSAGHFMANHTFNHDDLTKLSDTAIIETINKTRTAMLLLVSPDQKRLELSSTVVRPPGGNINMSVDKILKIHGYTSVRWNADRYDWNMPGDDARTTQIILERVRQQLDFIADHKAHGVEFNQSIMDLNHDWQPTTIDAIQDLISLVKSRGYEFVTLDECLWPS